MKAKKKRVKDLKIGKLLDTTTSGKKMQITDIKNDRKKISHYRSYRYEQ